MTMQKAGLAIASVSKTAGATASGYVDCYGYNKLFLQIWATTADVVSNKPSVLKLQHSDTTDATNFSDISGGVGGTDFTIPNADTSNPNGYGFNVDLRGKKRYVQAVISPRTTQTILATASLHRSDQMSVTAAKAGVLALVNL